MANNPDALEAGRKLGDKIAQHCRDNFDGQQIGVCRMTARDTLTEVEDDMETLLNEARSTLMHKRGRM